MNVYTTIGKAFKLKSGINLSSSNMNDGFYPVFGGNGISGYHDEFTFKERKILIGRVGAYCGNIHLSLPNSWITDNTLYIDEKLCDYDDSFLIYLLKSLNLNQYASQSGQPLISIGRIKDIKIPLPPLPQQQKIANILDAADTLRQNDKALIAKYDELTQALFLDMFGDPVSNPKGWEKEELGKILDVRDGTHDSPKYKDNGHPLVTSKNIKNGKLILDDVNYISEEDYNKINLRSKVDVGDIIMPMIGTIGNPLLVDFEVNFAIKNVALFKFKYNSIITNKLLLNLLNGHFLERFSSLNNKGGTQKFVSLGDIRKMIVPIPPLHLQNQFAERVAVIEEQKAIAQKSLEKSESLFNSLLQKAFQGGLG